MPDPIRKRFGYGQRAARIRPDRIIMSDPTFRIQFGSVFSKEGPDQIVQNRSGSDLNGLVRFGANTSCPQASRCARIIRLGSSRTQPARRWPGSYCAVPPRIRFSSLWLCQVLAKRIRSVGKPRCTRIIRLASEPNRVGSGMFTGNLFPIMFCAQVFN